MKVAELKEKIQDCPADQLQRIIVEMYKAIPKSVKEGQGIDALILNRGAGQRQPKALKIADIDVIRDELEEFLSNAYAQNYFAPNSIVPKRERPKWRFTARRLFKDLNQLVGEPDHTAEAAELLKKLYVMLCYSCDYVLFSAYDTFESVGVSQSDFFHALLTAKRKVETPRNFIRNSILLVLNNSLNRYTLYEGLMQILLSFLDTTDLKETAVEICDAVRIDVAKHRLDDRQKHSDDLRDYETKERLQNLAILGWMCFMALSLPNDAVKYFRKHYSEKDPEIALYVLLRKIGHCRCWDLWLKTYQEAVDSGVRPREELQRSFKEIRQKQSAVSEPID
jgi:hypothetical protein